VAVIHGKQKSKQKSKYYISGQKGAGKLVGFFLRLEPLSQPLVLGYLLLRQPWQLVLLPRRRAMLLQRYWRALAVRRGRVEKFLVVELFADDRKKIRVN
jgi:hypothetical protein